MKAIVRILFDGDIVGDPHAILRKAGCGPELVEMKQLEGLGFLSVEVKMEEPDPRVSRLLSLLAAHGEADPIVHRWDTFTDGELDAAPLLLMEPKRDYDIDGGVKFGTGYDIRLGCAACGTGAPQTTDLFVDGKELRRLKGHRAGATYHHHVFVDEQVAEELARIGATGFDLRRVHGRTSRDRITETPFRQLCPLNILPAMSPRTTGLEREDACSSCGRNGYLRMQDQPTRVVYRSADLAKTADVNMSWEWFGSSNLEEDLRKSFLAHPAILVRPRVYRVLHDAGVKEFDWIPIHVVDE